MTKSGAASKKLTPKRVALSSALACALMLGMLLAVSALISRELLPLSHERTYGCVCMFAGSALGSVLLVSGMSEGRAIAALINAGVIIVLIFAAGVAAGEGRISAAAIPYQLLCVGLGSITGCISTLRKIKRKRR